MENNWVPFNAPSEEWKKFKPPKFLRLEPLFGSFPLEEVENKFLKLRK